MNPFSEQSREGPEKRAWDPDALESKFASEADLTRVGDSTFTTRRFPVRRVVPVVAGALLLSALAVVGLRGVGRFGPVTVPSDASLQIESEPPGAEVRINGELRGRAPLVLALAPGTYKVDLGQGEAAKTRQVTLAPAERASVYHEFSQASADVSRVAPTSQGAALSVITEPAGGSVNIDDVDRGTAPVVVQNLSAGEHRLVVRNQGTVYRQEVRLLAGSTATVVVTGRQGLAAGWLAVKTPLTLQIHEAGSLLGTTETSRLMLTAGEHQLAFSDERTGFQVTQAVRIVPGETATVVLQPPRAPVNVNAIPWAEVWVDSERLGETPIGNYMLPLGNHQVELRHPELGTRRVTMSVSLSGPNRLAVNMRGQ
jgi:hypothetical protein